MLHYADLDGWAIEFDKTFPKPPDKLIEVKGRLIRKTFCKRCGKSFQVNHICEEVYYHIWNAYISFKNKEHTNLVDSMKEKFGF